MKPRLTTIGVDPGGRESGVVVRRGDQLLDFCVLTRVGEGTWPDAAYLEEVCGAVVGYRDQLDVTAALGPRVEPLSDCVVAVEGLHKPNPHMGMSSVAGILGTAVVLGAVQVMVPEAVVIPPARHGSGPLQAYPPQLVGAQEKSGSGKLRHCRSAWDVAGSALGSIRIGAAS